MWDDLKIIISDKYINIYNIGKLVKMIIISTNNKRQKTHNPKIWSATDITPISLLLIRTSLLSIYLLPIFILGKFFFSSTYYYYELIICKR